MSDLINIDKNFYDLIIVGAGPAGLSAAIYMARAKYKVLVLEKDKIGGQITITEEVVNYPGVERTSGKKLTETMRVQADYFGAEFKLATVGEMELEGKIKRIHTDKGVFSSLGVVLATGANPRKLGFTGEKEFQGRGVAYCATCDGEFFTDMNIFVVGGGFAAVEEGLFLTKYAKKVTFIVREEDFTCAKTVADKVKDHPQIDIHFQTQVVEVGGESLPSYAIFRNDKTGEEWRYEPGENFGVFVFAGYVPNTSWYPKSVEVNEMGYLVTDMNKKTNIDGVYGAGDVCVKNLRQVVTAVSDGAIAATSLEKHVSALHEELQIPELRGEEEGVKERPEPVEEDKKEEDGSFISGEIRSQLKGLFKKFANPVKIKAVLDNSKLAKEMEGFLEELMELEGPLSWEKQSASGEEQAPYMELFNHKGEETGVRFYAVPGGHEFNSFIVALYNVAGPGQEVDPSLAESIQAVEKKTNLKILISLSCTMCPETVMSAQRSAVLSENIEAHMFDLAHFPELKEKYNVMSVPCLVVNDSKVYFGKKNLEEMTKIIAENQ
ncbi:MAG: FAD-dependent oxidoreductase [Lachnospiraceae bacterium]|nr:FAD-dependent oxidoreductase [Lachnospiraceae bacterium]